jgi:Co/Zn/Cd efflux system component
MNGIAEQRDADGHAGGAGAGAHVHGEPSQGHGHDHAHDHGHGHDHAHGHGHDHGHDHDHDHDHDHGHEHGHAHAHGAACSHEDEGVLAGLFSKDHDHVDDQAAAAAASPRYRRILWIALVLNAAMAVIELGFGSAADSSALLADAVDFIGDAANFALSLGAIAMGLAWRSRVALLKGLTMAVYGGAVLAHTAWAAWAGATPHPTTMTVVGILAFAVNLGVAGLLYAYRSGDANMRAVWLCTRNDAIGNLLVIAAAVGVLGTGTRWPDLIVAGFMATLAINSGVRITLAARREMRRA